MKINKYIRIFVDLVILLVLLPFILYKFYKVILRFKLFFGIIFVIILIDVIVNLHFKHRKCKFQLNVVYKNIAGDLRQVMQIDKEGRVFYLVYKGQFGKFGRCTEKEFKRWLNKNK